MNREGIISVEEVNPQGRIERLPDGREVYDVEITLTETAHARIRLGYQCGRCMEVFEESWPNYCRVCGFDVGGRQREYYENAFVGSRVVKPSFTEQELRDGEERLNRMLKERNR